ncbi:MAG: hypothetical protein II682_06265, partial [Firmicutes bacterium]|nr:hypothetical protein [Bacillota bacterium]
EVIDKAYTPYNNLSLLVSLQSTGTIEKKVIASVTEALNIKKETKAVQDNLHRFFSRGTMSGKGETVWTIRRY